MSVVALEVVAVLGGIGIALEGVNIGGVTRVILEDDAVTTELKTTDQEFPNNKVATISYLL
jgi:hypothetical protein